MLLKAFSPTVRGLAADIFFQDRKLFRIQRPMDLTHSNTPELMVSFLSSEDNRVDFSIHAVVFSIPMHDAAFRFLRHSVFFQRRRDLRFIPAQFFSLQCNAIFVEVSVFVRFIKIGGQGHIELQRFQLGRQHREAVLAGNNRQCPPVVPLHMDASRIIHQLHNALCTWRYR